MVALFVNIHFDNILHGEIVLPIPCLCLIWLKSISIQVYFGGIEYHPIFNNRNCVGLLDALVIKFNKTALPVYANRLMNVDYV